MQMRDALDFQMADTSKQAGLGQLRIIMKNNFLSDVGSRVHGWCAKATQDLAGRRAERQASFEATAATHATMKEIGTKQMGVWMKRMSMSEVSHSLKNILMNHRDARECRKKAIATRNMKRALSRFTVDSAVRLVVLNWGTSVVDERRGSEMDELRRRKIEAKKNANDLKMQERKQRNYYIGAVQLGSLVRRMDMANIRDRVFIWHKLKVEAVQELEIRMLRDGLMMDAADRASKMAGSNLRLMLARILQRGLVDRLHLWRLKANQFFKTGIADRESHGAAVRQMKNTMKGLLKGQLMFLMLNWRKNLENAKMDAQEAQMEWMESEMMEAEFARKAAIKDRERVKEREKIRVLKLILKKVLMRDLYAAMSSMRSNKMVNEKESLNGILSDISSGHQEYMGSMEDTIAQLSLTLTLTLTLNGGHNCTVEAHFCRKKKRISR